MINGHFWVKCIYFGHLQKEIKVNVVFSVIGGRQSQIHIQPALLWERGLKTI